MKTLADFKRAMKPGTRWKAFNHIYGKTLGDRTCAKATTVCFGFFPEEENAGRISHCDWPKACDFAVNEKGQAEIYGPQSRWVNDEKVTERKLILTYEQVF